MSRQLLKSHAVCCPIPIAIPGDIQGWTWSFPRLKTRWYLSIGQFHIVVQQLFIFLSESYFVRSFGESTSLWGHYITPVWIPAVLETENLYLLVCDFAAQVWGFEADLAMFACTKRLTLDSSDTGFSRSLCTPGELISLPINRSGNIVQKNSIWLPFLKYMSNAWSIQCASVGFATSSFLGGCKPFHWPINRQYICRSDLTRMEDI